MGTRTWLRGTLALAVLGGLVAALIASPVGAFEQGDKKKVKKISKNLATDVVNQLAPGIATSTVNQLAPGIATQVAGPMAGRFAFAREDADAIVGTSGTILSTTITAPTNGHLAINAGGDAFGASGDDLDCILAVDGTQLLSTQRSVGFSTGGQEDCTTEGAVAVTAGSHTVSFDATFVDASVAMDEAVLWVLFVPFDASGNLPTGQSLG